MEIEFYLNQRLDEKRMQEERFEPGISQLQTDALESTATRDFLCLREFLIIYYNFHQT